MRLSNKHLKPKHFFIRELEAGDLVLVVGKDRLAWHLVIVGDGKKICYSLKTGDGNLFRPDGHYDWWNTETDQPMEIADTRVVVFRKGEQIFP